MPWEDPPSGQYIRSGHRDPSEFQQDTLRTITLSDSEGIKAIIGRPKGQDTTAIQSYLFDKTKGWTLEKAKTWFHQHQGAQVTFGDMKLDLVFNPDDFSGLDEFIKVLGEMGISEAEARAAWDEQQKIMQQSQKSGSYTCYGSLHSPFEKDGKHYALYRVIETIASGPTAPFGERWRPSYASMAKCLPTVMNAPLIGPPCETPGQQTGACDHRARRVMGKPVDWTMPDGYADVVYEITDPEAWQHIQDGSWRDVSPQVKWRERHFDGNVGVLDEWYFEHVALVNKGAFPNAELLDWWQNQASSWYTLRASLLQSHTPSPEGQSVLTDGAGTRFRQPADKTEENNGGISLSNSESSPDSQTLKGASAWDTADAPDDLFGYVPAEAKGPNGKKSLRKIPLASVEKKGLDEAIIRDAVARLPQSTIPQGEQPAVLSKICAAAAKLKLDLPSCHQGAGGTGGIDMTPEEKLASDKLASENETLKTENTRLQSTVAQLGQKVEILEKTKPRDVMEAALTSLKAKVEELETYKANAENEKILGKVNAVVSKRIDLGYATEADRVREIERLKTVEASALDMMLEDLEITEAGLAATGLPKHKFNSASSQRKTSSEDAIRTKLHMPFREPAKKE